MTTFLRSFSSLQLLGKCLKQTAETLTVPTRGVKYNIPKKRHPEWLPKPQRVLCDENITPDNKAFIQEYIESTYIAPAKSNNSPLKDAPIEPTVEWTPKSRRTGVIAKKIGVYPMWLKNGKKVTSTLLQVLDNHVIKYIPPDEFHPTVIARHLNPITRNGALIVGSDSVDPQLLKKEYTSLFAETGVMPKRILMRFIVSPDAALQPGTPLFATHFRPGDVLDIRAKTVDRGFQGVMKRWGFKGMPASHGVTKTHRRGGNIGSGGKKARVMPGTKMPGHMGNRWRVHRGIRILRINTKYNVIWILGHNLPGETNSFCYLYDTLLKSRRSKTPPHFPTYIPNEEKEPLPENLYAEDVHRFEDPTIEFKPES